MCIAFASATQNEINAKDAQNMVNNSIHVVSQGANMAGLVTVADAMMDQGAV